MPVRRRRIRGRPGAGDGEDRPPPVATVERAGQGIAVRPPCEEALRPLVTAIHVAAVHAKLGFQTVTRPFPLIEVEDMPWGRQAVMPAGLEPVARGLLERAGIAVVVEERAVTPLPAPASPAGTAGVADRAVVDFVRGHDRGLVRLGTGVCAAKLVAQLRLAFPDATIAVAATRREDVRRFGQALKVLFPSACWSLGDDFPADPGPLVVSTNMGLSDHGLALHRRDILVCLDAREALGRDACLAIGHADRARLFGFIGRDERLASYDRDRIRALFGFDALDVPRHGHVARPVEARFARMAGGPVPPCPDIVSLKRGGLWANPVRNRRVSRLAVALAAGDGPGLAAESPTIAAWTAGVDMSRVFVVVEAVEHALALADRLPGWGLLAGPDVATAGLPARHRHILEGRIRAGEGRPCRAIATLAGLGATDVEDADVVIRADGGVGIPEALESGLSMTYPAGRPLLLVDLDDRHHPELRRRSRARRGAYLDRGWAVDGTAGPSSPLDVFLSTRPGRGS